MVGPIVSNMLIRNTLVYGADLASSASVTQSYTSGTHTANLAVDNDIDTYAYGAQGYNLDDFFLDFGSAKRIRRFRNYVKYGGIWVGACALSIGLYYSDNASTYTLATTMSFAASTGWQEINLADYGAHRYWKLLNADVSNGMALHEIEMMEASLA